MCCYLNVHFQSQRVNGRCRDNPTFHKPLVILRKISDVAIQETIDSERTRRKFFSMKIYKLLSYALQAFSLLNESPFISKIFPVLYQLPVLSRFSPYLPFHCVFSWKILLLHHPHHFPSPLHFVSSSTFSSFRLSS